MKNIRLITITILFTVWFSHCDSSHKWHENLKEQALCYNLGICSELRGTRFAILGDSWTDLAGGMPLVRTLRVQLAEDHGYQLTGSTITGNRLQLAHDNGLHFQVIETAGPDLKYMIISLGGNDLLQNFPGYLPDIQNELHNRLAALEDLIIDFVQSGNNYKRNRWGGQNLIWFFHGYDYLNPEIGNPSSKTMCRTSLQLSGFSDAEIDQFHVEFIDSYYNMLFHAASIESSLRILDLRRSLGGPPFAINDLMLDCMHPNSIGFSAITTSFVNQMRIWTGDEK